MKATGELVILKGITKNLKCSYPV